MLSSSSASAWQAYSFVWLIWTIEEICLPLHFQRQIENLILLFFFSWLSLFSFLGIHNCQVEEFFCCCSDLVVLAARISGKERLSLLSETLDFSFMFQLLLNCLKTSDCDCKRFTYQTFWQSILLMTCTSFLKTPHRPTVFLLCTGNMRGDKASSILCIMYSLFTLL